MNQTMKWVMLGVAMTVAGCESTGPHDSSQKTGSATQTGQDGSRADVAANTKPLAYIDGLPLSKEAMLTPLLEASGGQILSEIVVGRAVQRKLSEAGITLSAQQIEDEKKYLALSLDPDPNAAQRLVNELRTSRGLGSVRFDQFLARQAGLRALIKDQAQVTDAAIKQEYDLQYGEKYEVRLIVVPTLQKAAEILDKARKGDSFMDLAITQSTDSSAPQGGLIPPINLADATYPAAVRMAVKQLKAGDISEPVALEREYALLKLERKIDAKAVQFDDVKKSLSQQVLLNAQRVLMLRLARTMLTETDVIVTDSALKKSWDQQRNPKNEVSQ